MSARGVVRAASGAILAAQAGSVLALSGATAASLAWECPIRSALGIQCPGCGATRCIQALAAGDPVVALRDNALVAVTMLAVSVAAVVGLLHPQSLAWSWTRVRRHGPAIIVAGTVVIVVFTALRNIPWYQG